MSDPFLHCSTCACMFLTKHDLNRHKSVCGINLDWLQNKYGGWWAYAEKMPKLSQAVRANGKLTMNGYDITLDPSGKFLHRRLSNSL